MKIIKLSQGQCAKVDDDDFKKYAKTKWFAKKDKTRNCFYAVANNYGRSNGTILMHRLITGNPKGLVVDHKNHDTLDNRKKNLRPCTTSQNLANRKGLDSNNTSGVRGVYWHSIVNKWAAQIMVNGENKRLGYFVNKDKAARVYAKANRYYFGEFGGLS